MGLNQMLYHVLNRWAS